MEKGTGLAKCAGFRRAKSHHQQIRYYIFHHRNSCMNDKELRANSRSRPTQTVASFLLKTYEILERPDLSHIISWDKDDEGFVVKDLLQFTNEILPKYFRHNNFSSFVRQLNMYDFHKIKQNNDNFVFKNPLFRRGCHHLLKDIKRKASKRTENDRKLSQLSCEGAHSQRNQNVPLLLKKSVRQAKTLIESEVANSASLFEKSITILDTQLLQIDSLAQYSNNTASILAGPFIDQRRTDLMDVMYSIKKVSFDFLANWHSVWDAVDNCCNQKEQLYQRLLQNSKKTTSTMELPVSASGISAPSERLRKTNSNRSASFTCKTFSRPDDPKLFNKQSQPQSMQQS